MTVSYISVLLARVSVWGWKGWLIEAWDWVGEWEGERQSASVRLTQWEWVGDRFLVWEWVGFCESESALVCVRVRGCECEWEWENRDGDIFKFWKSPIGNRVSKTRFLGASMWIIHVGKLIATSYTRGNRVLETRFPCECQVATLPHQRWSKHTNRASKTRFWRTKSSLSDSRC